MKTYTKLKLLLILPLTIVYFVSCNSSTNENKQKDEKSDEELLEIKESKRAKVINDFAESDGMKLRFQAKDTLIDVTDEIRVRISKKSFLSLDSSIYDGFVNLSIEFVNDSSDNMFYHYTTNPKYNWHHAELKGIIKIYIMDDYGSKLLLNKAPNTPVLGAYSARDELMNRIWRSDSLCNCSYYDLIAIDLISDKIKKEKKESYQKGVYDKNHIRHTFYVPEEYFSAKRPFDTTFMVNYLDVRIDVYSAIEHALLQKVPHENSVAFYLNTNNKIETQRKTIDVFIETDIEDVKASVMLYSHEPNNKNILIGRKANEKYYKIVWEGGPSTPKIDYNHWSAAIYTNLHLPVNNEYTLIAYFIHNGKIYYAKTKKMKTPEIEESITLKMKEISFDKFIHVIKNM